MFLLGDCWGLPVCWQFLLKLSIMCWIIRISILICNCDQCDWREWGEEGGKPWAISAPRVLHHRLHIRSDESKHRQVCALHSAPQHSHNWNVLRIEPARHNKPEEETQQSTWLGSRLSIYRIPGEDSPESLKSVRFALMAIWIKLN